MKKKEEKVFDEQTDEKVVQNNENQDENVVVDDNTEQQQNFEEQEEVEEIIEKEERKRKAVIDGESHKKTLWILILVFLVFVAIAMFCIFNKINTNVYKNIFLGDKEMSGMTSVEAGKYIQSVEQELQTIAIDVKQGENVITDITAQEIDLGIDNDKTLKEIMDYGRKENLLSNNIKILKTLFSKHSAKIEYTYSEDKLNTIIQEILGSIENKVINDSYSFDENKYMLIITRGKSGNGIDIDEFKKDIIDALISEEKIYNIKTITQKPEEIDVDVVYSKIVRKAQDAYVDETVKPIKFVKHVVGIDFNKQELRTLLSKTENLKEGVTVRFKVKTTQPKVKLSDIKWNLYVDKLSGTTTYFTASDRNRSNNLKVGLSILQGTVVMPGETFSFNNTMGDCGLSSRGFKPAATFKAGKVVKEVGGGICQVASTLYNSALKANLQIVKRSNHALPVGYVKPSLDATVYYPYVDFRFKNTRNYPIKIVTSYNSGGRMSISIMGTFEEVEYDVVLSSTVTGSVASKKEYVNDATLPAGTTKVIKKGTNGYTSVGYRILKLNGKTISKTFLSSDTYKGTITTVAVGTKAATPVVAPVQTPEPEPVITPVVTTP